MSLPAWPHVLSGGSASRWRGLGTDFLVVGTEAGSMHPTGMHSCSKSIDDHDHRDTRGFMS